MTTEPVKYTKEVTVDKASTVTVDVYDEARNNVGSNFYMYSILADMFPFIFSQNEDVKRRIEKAHKWADRRIEVLTTYIDGDKR